MPKKHKNFIQQERNYQGDVLQFVFNEYAYLGSKRGAYQLVFIPAGKSGTTLESSLSFTRINAVWEFLIRQHQSVWHACAASVKGLAPNM